MSTPSVVGSFAVCAAIVAVLGGVVVSRRSGVCIRPRPAAEQRSTRRDGEGCELLHTPLVESLLREDEEGPFDEAPALAPHADSRTTDGGERDPAAEPTTGAEASSVLVDRESDLDQSECAKPCRTAEMPIADSWPRSVEPSEWLAKRLDPVSVCMMMRSSPASVFVVNRAMRIILWSPGESSS